MPVAQPDCWRMDGGVFSPDSGRKYLVSVLERMLLRQARMVASNPAVVSQPTLRSHAGSDRLERLFFDHYRFIWRTLRRLGVNEAGVDDCAQKVFIVASNRLDAIELGRERSFLTGVAVRVAANARRTESRSREDADSDVVNTSAAQSNPEELLEWKQRRQKLDDWLLALSLELRAPFVLFELEGLALAEIAEVLELPVGTVKTRLRKARAIFLQVAGSGGAR